MKKIIYTTLVVFITINLCFAQKNKQSTINNENALVYLTKKMLSAQEPSTEDIAKYNIVRYKFDVGMGMVYTLWKENSMNNYSKENMNKLGYEFLGIETKSFGYIVNYRNCQKGIVVEITNMGSVITINLQWFAKSTRKSISALFSCP